MEPDDAEEILSDEIAALFDKQDAAMTLMERLRSEEPYKKPKSDTTGEGRRDFRRWPIPAGVSVEWHDGDRWQLLDCKDMGVGGARIQTGKGNFEGPFPARLKAPRIPSTIVLADVMWRDTKEKTAGLRFEFQDEEERDTWAGGLIDALLAQHALS